MVVINVVFIVVSSLLDGFGNKTRIDYGTGISSTYFNNVHCAGMFFFRKNAQHSSSSLLRLQRGMFTVLSSAKN